MCDPTALLASNASQSKTLNARQNHALRLSQAQENKAFSDKWAKTDYQESLRRLNKQADQGRDASRRAQGARIAKGAGSGLTRSGSRLDALFDAKARESKSILDTLNEGKRSARLRREQRLAQADKQYRQRKSSLDLSLQQAEDDQAGSNNPFASLFGSFF